MHHETNKVITRSYADGIHFEIVKRDSVEVSSKSFNGVRDAIECGRKITPGMRIWWDQNESKYEVKK